MKTIDQLNFNGKKALIRVDFNVPLNESFEITDDKRISAAIPTIKKILSDGGAVVLMSHLGRPKNGPESKFSLKHIIPCLSSKLGLDVQFAEDCIGDSAVNKAKDLKLGEVLLLENLRFYKEEENGDEDFAQKLARLGDVYVNDAFGTAHRAHASTAVIAKFFGNNKYFGYLMASEIENAERVLTHAKRPFTAIMGGAKVSDKIELIDQLLNKVDNLIIGGGMAYTFVKALGGSIGNSLLEADKVDLALSILEKAKSLNVKIHLPVDAIIADKFSNDADSRVEEVNEIPDGWMGLDIGPASVLAFSDVIKKSKTLLWNGPMGVFEMEKFKQGTYAISNALVDATELGAFSLVGGGDSAAAIALFKLEDQVSYVSTGGGALLEYMEGKELPGITAINS